MTLDAEHDNLEAVGMMSWGAYGDWFYTPSVR